MLNFVQLCSTLFNFVQLCSTLFNLRSYAQILCLFRVWCMLCACICLSRRTGWQGRTRWWWCILNLTHCVWWWILSSACMIHLTRNYFVHSDIFQSLFKNFKKDYSYIGIVAHEIILTLVKWLTSLFLHWYSKVGQKKNCQILKLGSGDSV